MFDRPDAGERALLVHPHTESDEEDFAEFRELALSAGADPVAVVTCRRQTPDPRHFIGKGKLEEVLLAVTEHDAELVLFDHALTPSQERNLEKALSVRVVDRTGLILDIFAQRARTFEGKLQVELAQLRHLATRLVRGWTHLERQKGGIGLRGPGETQLETDKRLLADRIRLVQKRLEKVEQQRNQGRQARKRAEVPVVGLVGYTNAGKSTLFNTLTQASVYAADQLFATLDPTLRRHHVAPHLAVVLADTVGFIRHLPHELVAAFRSTLSEASDADLLLHLIDAGDERVDDTIAEVEAVLGEIGADRVPRIRVYNKIDLTDNPQPRLERDQEGKPIRAWISARDGVGLDLLNQAIVERLSGATVSRTLHIPPTQGAIRAKLYVVAKILRDEVDENGGWHMEVEIPQRDIGVLKSLEAPVDQSALDTP
ncbi:ribosome rescue GTPase HflX [Methylococcus sp. EFPC2]|uniref:ribosome rescue GTPase HflX n=1 Tax=Methylococcus sp. EFPC2 TaxID=2812648 RepID=UPI001967784E|nr:ribosome rescue GTPase HflX [Methylococcus sp. EFPC2]QSA97609.1 GTPase HflX [Methylococcus sp. EFPC2]